MFHPVFYLVGGEFDRCRRRGSARTAGAPGPIATTSIKVLDGDVAVRDPVAG